MKRRTFLTGAVATTASALLAPVATSSASAATKAPTKAVTKRIVDPPPSRLLWSDDFVGPAGSAPNPAKWAHQLGRYGSNERQYYVNSTRNAWLSGSGNLIIKPICERTPDGAAAPNNYTSARLVTRGIAEFTPPVRIQANIKVPGGYGIMPAFWSLGADPARPEAWPHEGEIDIMEAIRFSAPTSWLPQTVHGPALTSDAHIAVGNTYQGSTGLDAAFHRYGIDWWPDHIDFHLDNLVIFTVTKDMFNAAGGSWTPFDGTWGRYLLLNTAVIGSVPAKIKLQPMAVDWVRVWSLA